MAKKQQIMYPVLAVVAASLYAFKMNNEDIVQVSKAGNGVLANSFIMQKVLVNGEQPTDQELATAAEVLETIRNNYIVKLLTGEYMSDFYENISRTVQDEQLDSHTIGLLAYIPKLYKHIVTKQARDAKVSEVRYNSKPLGDVRELVLLDFTLISHFYIMQYDMYTCLGTDSTGNLVKFWTKKEQLFAGPTVRIIGKVKSIITDDRDYAGTTITQLNYVKPV